MCETLLDSVGHKLMFGHRGSMYARAVTCSIPEWSLCISPISNICRVQWKLPYWILNCQTASRYIRGFTRCSYFATEGAGDRVTTHGCIAQQFHPVKLLVNNCLHSGPSKNHTFVNSNWCAVLIKSITRYYSFLNENNVKFHYCTRENCRFEPATVRASGSLADYSCHSMVCDQWNDIGMWHCMKHALLNCLPVQSTNDFLSYFMIIRRLFMVSRSFENDTCSASQKPDKDSGKKPTANHLHNIQQLMMQQVVLFLLCSAVQIWYLLQRFCPSVCHACNLCQNS